MKRSDNITKDIPTGSLPCLPMAENVVLGTIMSDRDALNNVRELLSIDTFFVESNRTIYTAILNIDAKGDRPDIVSVTTELHRMGAADLLSELMSVAKCYTYDIYQHAAALQTVKKRREFYELGLFFMNNALNGEKDVVEVMEEGRKRLDKMFSTGRENVTTLDDAIVEAWEGINKNLQGGCEISGDRTGFAELDKRTGGLQPSHLTIIAADTAMGKTSLAMKIALSADVPLVIYSMEMQKKEIAARMMSCVSGVEVNKVLYLPLNATQLNSVDKAVKQIRGRKMYFDDGSSNTIDSILASIRMMKHKYGIKGAIVDYLQILNAVDKRNSNPEQLMADIARWLKNIAKELDIWVIALSQLNRDWKNPVPNLGRLRSSGQISEAADEVLMVYRPEYYGPEYKYPEPFENKDTAGTAMIMVEKGRNCGTFKFLAGFQKETTNFYDLAAEAVPSVEEEEQPF